MHHHLVQVQSTVGIVIDSEYTEVLYTYSKDTIASKCGQ